MSGPDLTNVWICRCGSANSLFWAHCRHCQADAPDLEGEVKVTVHGGVAPELVADEFTADEWPDPDDPPDPL